MSKKYSFLKLLTIISIFILFISASLFTYFFHFNYVRADEWRFLELFVMPLYNNSFHMSLLWIDHHPQPLTALLFIISSEYFHLSINLFSYIGIISKIIFCLLFLYLLNSSIIKWKETSKYLLMIVIVSIFFSLKSINEYHWGLVTLSNFWFVVLLGVFFFLDRALKENVYKNGIVFGILVLFLLIGVKDFATIGVAGIAIFLIALLFLFEKQKKAIILLLFLLASFLLFKIFWILLGVEPQHASKLLFVYKSLNVLGALHSCAIALLSGFVNIDILKILGFNNFYLLFFGYLVLFSYLYIIFCYFKHELYNESSIPLLLILYLFLFIIALFLFRFFPISSEIDWRLASPRYTKVYEIGAMALVWASVLLTNKTNIFKKFKYILYIIGIILLFLNLVSVLKAWNFSKYLVSANSKIEKTLHDCYENNQSCKKLPKWMIGSSFTQEKIVFLKENYLNIFYERGNDQ